MAPIPSYTSLLRPMRVYAPYKNFGFSQKKSVWRFHTKIISAVFGYNSLFYFNLLSL